MVPLPHFWWQTPLMTTIRCWIQRLLLFPPLALVTWRMRIDGAHHLAGLHGPVIVVANHSSHFDTPIVLRALPAKLRRRLAVAAAADYFYSNKLASVAVSLSLNTFPFDRQAEKEQAMRQCQRLVTDGWSLLIFPEGTRSPDGTIHRFRRGVGCLASSLRVPVVPIHLEGPSEIMPKGRWWARPSAVTVRIGQPMTFGPEANPAIVANAIRESVVMLAAHELKTQSGDTSPEGPQEGTSFLARTRS